MKELRKILAHIPGYIPSTCNGGSLMIRDYLLSMQERGYEVKVLCDNTPVNEFEGIEINTNEGSLYSWADIVITHLGKTGAAINTSEKYRKPLVWISHSTIRTGIIQKRAKIGVIYNSEWMVGATPYTNPYVVCRPICRFEKYNKSNGDYITIIGLNKNKGGWFLKQIAEKMPEYKFLVVKNSYGSQFTDFPDNVKVENTTFDIEKIYKQTKILLICSRYESYCRVGIEGLFAGLKVIAYKNEGTKESLGKNAVLIDDFNIENWIKAIKNTDKIDVDLSFYRNQAQKDIDTFENFLKSRI